MSDCSKLLSQRLVDNLDQERTLLEGVIYYVSILLKHRWIIIAITAIAAVAVIAFCAGSIYLPPAISPLPDKYTANAVLLVQRGAKDDLSMSIRTALGIASTPADTDPSADSDNSALILLALQSRSFLDKIIDEFDIVHRYGITDHVRTNSRKLLLTRLRFEYSSKTGTITISFTDLYPVFARDLTNRVVALLVEWYAQNIGSSKIRQAQLLAEKVNDVKADIDKLESRQKELQTQYGMLTAQDLGTSQASALAALRSQLILKEIDIKNYSAIATTEDPKMLQMKEERQNILNLIDRVQQGAPGTADNPTSLKSIPDVQTEFNNITADLDVQRKIYNTISHQYDVLKLTSDSQPPFQVMELAEVPDAKSGPQRTRIIAEVIALAFIASVAFVFLLNGVSQVRRDQERKGLLKRAIDKRQA